MERRERTQREASTASRASRRYTHERTEDEENGKTNTTAGRRGVSARAMRRRISGRRKTEKQEKDEGAQRGHNTEDASDTARDGRGAQQAVRKSTLAAVSTTLR